MNERKGLPGLLYPEPSQDPAGDPPDPAGVRPGPAPQSGGAGRALRGPAAVAMAKAAARAEAASDPLALPGLDEAVRVATREIQAQLGKALAARDRWRDQAQAQARELSHLQAELEREVDGAARCAECGFFMAWLSETSQGCARCFRAQRDEAREEAEGLRQELQEMAAAYLAVAEDRAGLAGLAWGDLGPTVQAVEEDLGRLRSHVGRLLQARRRLAGALDAAGADYPLDSRELAGAVAQLWRDASGTGQTWITKEQRDALLAHLKGGPDGLTRDEAEAEAGEHGARPGAGVVDSPLPEPGDEDEPATAPGPVHSWRGEPE